VNIGRYSQTRNYYGHDTIGCEAVQSHISLS
jgi:hypothetical protein